MYVDPGIKILGLSNMYKIINNI